METFVTDINIMPVIRQLYERLERRPGSAAQDIQQTMHFMLELYRHTGDAQVWNDILALCDQLEAQPINTLSNNYVLAGGSMGMAWLYLELFRTTGQQRWLKNARAIAERYFEGWAYRYDMIETSGLANGLAGVIMVLLRLYQETGEAPILKGVEQLLLKLIYHSECGQHGVYWGGATNWSASNIGFGKGVAGIAFLLAQAGRFFSDERLQLLAGKALDYEAGFWNIPANHVLAANLQDTGCYSGVNPVGVKLAQISADNSLTILSLLPAKASDHTIAAEMGLASLALFDATGDAAAYQDAAEQAARLMANESDRAAIEGYFLLKYMQAAQHIRPDNNRQLTIGTLPAGSIFQRDTPDLVDTFICASYRKTYTLLQQLLPDVLAGYHLKHGLPDIATFEQYLDAALDKAGERTEATAVKLEYEREQFILNARRSLKDNWEAMDDDASILELEHLMYQSTEQFLSLRLVHSDDIIVKSWEPELDVERTLTLAEFGQFFQHYGARTCICYVTQDDELQETFPGVIRLVFDQFAKPTTIREARQRVTDFIKRQPAAAIAMLKDHYVINDDEEFMKKVGNLVIDGARLYLMEKIFKVVP